MPDKRSASGLLLSRRKVIGALGGAAALAGLTGCGSSGSNDTPIQYTAKIIDGYTDRQSYSVGDSVTLYLNTDLAQRTYVNIYDYAGTNVYSVLADVFPQQPVGNEPWATGFGYQPTVTFALPALQSGVYLIGDSVAIPLIVKNPVASGIAAQADVVIVYPTNTIAAYNNTGGRSMYSAPTKATTVSFHRPAGAGSNLAFITAFIEWLASFDLPYRIAYVADIDLENYAEIAGAKLLMIIGHSEYWTRTARENFDRFVLGGGNALLLSGNTMWWQVRYSADMTQMICYKNVPDPTTDPLLETINWTQPRLQYPTMRSTGTDFLHGGFGLQYPTGGGFKIVNAYSPIFKDVDIFVDRFLGISTLEYDGAPLLNNPVTNGLPQLDMATLGAYRAEIVGYEGCTRNETENLSAPRVADAVATWIVYQRTISSGIVINGASTNWCSRSGAFGSDGFRVRQVILNMMNILVNKLPVFSS